MSSGSLLGARVGERAEAAGLDLGDEIVGDGTSDQRRG